MLHEFIIGRKVKYKGDEDESFYQCWKGSCIEHNDKEYLFSSGKYQITAHISKCSCVGKKITKILSKSKYDGCNFLSVSDADSCVYHSEIERLVVGHVLKKIATEHELLEIINKTALNAYHTGKMDKIKEIKDILAIN
jgi:hypothetical protein